MQFPLFERLKQSIKAYRDECGLTRGTVAESGVITAISAGSAGALAAVLTTPIDVVKTRIMLAAVDGPEEATSCSKKGSGLVDAQGKSQAKDRLKSAARNMNPMAPSETKGRKSSWKIGQDIVAEKGFKGLWRGGALRGVWTFIGAGCYLGAYESGRVYLAARRGEKVDEDDLL